MSILLSILLLLPLISAQTAQWGPCPAPSVQPNFKLERYLGRWYEIERIPFGYSWARAKCVETDFSVRKDGTIKVVNSQKHKDKLRSSEGTAVIRSKVETAKLGVSFSYFTPYSPYWVLTTDYTSLAIVYSCTDILHIFHFQSAWILGRSRFLPPTTIEYAKNLLEREGINVYKMRPTDQNCKEK